MPNFYNVENWYWTVGDRNPSTEVYSSAARAFVLQTDTAYTTFLAEPGDFTTIPLADFDELIAILQNQYPGGLPLDATYPIVATASYDSKINLLINPEFRVNQRGITSGISRDEFGPDLWSGDTGANSTAPTYDPATGEVTTPGNLSVFKQQIERAFWSAGYVGERLTVSVEDLEYVSGAAGGLELTIGGVDITLTPGPGVRAVSFVVPVGATGDFLTFRLNSGGTYRYKRMALVRGETPFDGEPRNLEAETALCRYYYIQPATDPAGSLKGRSVFSGAGDPVNVINARPNIFMARGALFGFIAPSNTTSAPTALGCSVTTATTITYQYAPASGARWARTPRKRHTTTTTAGQQTGMRTNYALGLHASSTAGQGGYYVSFYAGHETNTTGYQLFAGLCSSTAALAGDPSSLINCVGIGYDAGDNQTANWFLIHNDASGAATKIDLGANAVRTSTQGFFVELFNAPGSLYVNYRVTAVNSLIVVAEGVLTTDVPITNQGLALKFECRNGAIAAAATVEYGMVYFESCESAAA